MNTWHEGRGNSLDRAALLVALLRAAKVPARVALVSDKPGRDVSAKVPGPFFDHVLVVVPGRRPVWIDPRSDVARAGELPSYAQGRRALILDRKSRGLVTTPTTSAADNVIIEHREIFLAGHGPARVVETTTLTGLQERIYRKQYGASKTDEIRKTLDDYAGRIYGGHLDRYTTSAPDDLTTSFTLHLEVSDAGFYSVSDDTAWFFLRSGSAFDELPELLANKDHAPAATARRNDLLVDAPNRHEIVYDLHLPAGYVADQLPASDELHLGVVTLHREVASTADRVTVRYRMELPKARLTADEVRETHKAVRAFLEGQAWSIRVRPLVERELEAAHVARAVRELRALIDREPDRAELHLQLSQALLEIGLQQPGVAEARAAVALRRDSSTLHRLGWALDHDRFGRMHGPGFDRAGAIRAYRASLKLDPSPSQTMVNLAITLEYDCNGTRYQGDLGESIALFRRYLAGHGDDEQQRLRLLFALARAGRWHEARELGASMPASKARDELLVAAVAGDTGPDAAIAQANALSKDPADLLKRAADQVTAARDYVAARTLLLRAAPLDASKKATLLYEAAVFFRVKKDQPLAPWTDPRRPVQQALKLLLARPGDEASLKRLYAPIARAVHRRPPHAALATALRKKMDKAVFRGRVSAELFLGNSTFHADETAWGARVTVASPFLPSGWSPLQAFVVRDGKRWRLLDLTGGPETLAAQALRVAASGDTAGLHQWMEWAQPIVVGLSNKAVYGGPIQGGTLAQGPPPPTRSPAEEDRLAAALALAGTPESGQSVPILERCVSADNGDMQCWDALFEAGAALGDADLMRRADAALTKAGASSRFSPAFRSFELARATDRWADLERLARSKMAADPTQLPWKRTLAIALSGAGDAVGGNALLRKVADETESAYDENAFAWDALIIGVHDDDVLAAARSAVANGRGNATLNTLAAVQAARGELSAARATLIEAVDADDSSRPRLADWLVMGRIAQELDYPDLARSIYERLPDDHGAGQGSYALAQRWLSELAAAPGAAP